MSHLQDIVTPRNTAADDGSTALAATIAGESTWWKKVGIVTWNGKLDSEVADTQNDIDLAKTY